MHIDCLRRKHIALLPTPYDRRFAKTLTKDYTTGPALKAANHHLLKVGEEYVLTTFIRIGCSA